MKPLPIKIDDYLIEKIESEANRKGLTKAEIVRAAIIHYFIHRDDIEDARLIESRLDEEDIPASEVKF